MLFKAFRNCIWLFLFIVFLCAYTSHAYFFDIITPAPITPENNARFGRENPSVIFSWSCTDAAYYEIEIALDDEFEVSTEPIAVDSVEYDLYSLVPPDIWDPMEITLYWRVRSVYISYSFFHVTSSWSSTRVFYKTILGSPVPLSPSDDARFSTSTSMPFFQWCSNDVNSGYQVEFAADRNFYYSYGLLETNDTSLDFSAADRSAWDSLEGIFYWRVAAVSENLTPGPWSEVRSFSKTTIDAPVIIWPADETRFPPRSHVPFLEWHPLDTGGTEYQLRFSLDREGNDIISVMDIEGTRLDFADYISETEWWFVFANFYWSVSGFDDHGRPGPWSIPAEFTKVGWHRISAFGDSITYGECVENGYLSMLSQRLSQHWSRFSTVNQAVPGTKSRWGEETIERVLAESCPQYILILFGANDAVDPGNCDPPYGCDVEDHLAAMVQIARSRGTIPIISTILPVNPEGAHAGAQWRVDMYNESIREMAANINAPFVDLNEMFWDVGETLPSLFCDWGHPSWEGYDIMAEGFYQGILSYGT